MSGKETGEEEKVGERIYSTSLERKQDTWGEA